MSEENQASEEVLEVESPENEQQGELGSESESEDSGKLSLDDMPESSAEQEDFSSDADTKEELQEDIADAIDKGATPEDVKSMVKEFKLKVNGEEVTRKYDFSDDKELEKLKRDLQIGEANKQGMQRAKELEKLYSQSISKLKENPWDVLKELGLDPMEMAESKINEYIEEQKKSPEQLERETMQKELEEARAELKRQKEEQEQTAFGKLQEQEAGRLNDEITEALDAHKTLPKSRKTVSRIADALLWAMDNGFDNASVADVIPMVEEEIRTEMRDFMEVLGETDMLEEYIGQKNIEKMRGKRLAKAKVSGLNNVVPTSKSRELQEGVKEEMTPIRAKDFFRNPLKYTK